MKIFFSEKKSHSAEKTEKGDSLVCPGMVCYAEKNEKTFLVQFARPNVSIWDHKILYNFVELFWSVRVD